MAANIHCYLLSSIGNLSLFVSYAMLMRLKSLKQLPMATSIWAQSFLWGNAAIQLGHMLIWVAANRESQFAYKE